MAAHKQLMDPMISSADSNEYVNAISHLIGTILSISGMTFLILSAAIDQKWLHLISFVIYGITLLASFIASCFLHFFLLLERYKRIFGILDHCAIYLFIAGTYTPLCLIILPGTLGWALCGSIWILAFFFIALKIRFFARLPPIIAYGGYLIMGWLSIIILFPLYLRLGLSAVVLMGSGGLLYTAGATVMVRGRPNLWPPYFGSHEIWHICVLIANAIFFCVMLFFVLPYNP